MKRVVVGMSGGVCFFGCVGVAFDVMCLCVHACVAPRVPQFMGALVRGCLVV